MMISFIELYSTQKQTALSNRNNALHRENQTTAVMRNSFTAPDACDFATHQETFQRMLQETHFWDTSVLPPLSATIIGDLASDVEQIYDDRCALDAVCERFEGFARQQAPGRSAQRIWLYDALSGLPVSEIVVSVAQQEELAGTLLFSEAWSLTLRQAETPLSPAVIKGVNTYLMNKATYLVDSSAAYVAADNTCAALDHAEENSQHHQYEAVKQKQRQVLQHAGRSYEAQLCQRLYDLKSTYERIGINLSYRGL